MYGYNSGFDATMKLIQDVGQWRHASHVSRSEDVDIGVLHGDMSGTEMEILVVWNHLYMEAQQKFMRNKGKKTQLRG